MGRAPTVMWLRLDLRLADNPALVAAAEAGPVVPLFIWAPEEEGRWAPGAASRWWLERSLRSLDESLRAIGSRLVLRRGSSAAVLREVVRESGASRVVWSSRPEPALAARDALVADALAAEGVVTEAFDSAVVFPPSLVARDGGRPYQVFTPFWRACLTAADRVRLPLPAPARLAAPARWPASLAVGDLELTTAHPWGAGLAAHWEPGEPAARRRLDAFIAGGLTGYAAERDRPDHEGTSRLSPHLHFGELAPHTAWHAARRAPAGEAWLRQLAWREFAHHLLVHFPHTTDAPLRAEFARFPWRDDPRGLAAWRRGRTGVALVDAGMRELWTTGWMHNRARMNAASFLVKGLLVDWREGARWFWDTLVDADLASNTLGWQWVAGSGADAAPYFRIFNPALQAERFDPEGAYRRRWAPDAEARSPLVDPRAARTRALEAFAALRRG